VSPHHHVVGLYLESARVATENCADLLSGTVQLRSWHVLYKWELLGQPTYSRLGWRCPLVHPSHPNMVTIQGGGEMDVGHPATRVGTLSTNKVAAGYVRRTPSFFYESVVRFWVFPVSLALASLVHHCSFNFPECSDPSASRIFEHQRTRRRNPDRNR
jgi:hypothetical protein